MGKQRSERLRLAKVSSAMIEPSRGATYRHEGEWSVYGYGTYERGSVLEGQEKRVFLDGGYKSPEAAKAAWPEAEVSEGSNYRPPSLMHLPGPEDPDPTGENRTEADDYRNE